MLVCLFETDKRGNFNGIRNSGGGIQYIIEVGILEGTQYIIEVRGIQYIIEVGILEGECSI